MKMNSKSLFPIGLFLLNASLTFGQIHDDESRLQWRLDSGQMTYVMGVNDQKMSPEPLLGPQIIVRLGDSQSEDGYEGLIFRSFDIDNAA
jgi:hypothetical protein